MIRRKFRLLVLLASIWLLGIGFYLYKASQDHVSFSALPDPHSVSVALFCLPTKNS